MGRHRKLSDDEQHTRQPRALTPEAREEQLVNLAVNLAEKQLREGTASSQVITHYLKLASTKEKLEKRYLEEKVNLAKAKTDSIHDARHIEELYTNAINAMRRYGASFNRDDDIEEDDDYY